MVYADLHVHTTASDGTLALEEVPAAAREAGCAVVAVTDHDRVHPGLPKPIVERDGVRLVRGIELRVETGFERLDLLGYGVTRTPALVEELDALQRNRRERARTIVSCCERRLGVDLDVSIEDGVGRPHVARAVVAHPDTPHDEIGAVFDDLIDEDGPCYESRAIPAYERGVAVLDAAADLVSLAHPLRYDDPEAALALAGEQLDAVERHYPYRSDDAGADRDGDGSLIDEAIEEFDLLVTGGSDAHGTELGAAGLGRAAYERLGL